MITLAKKGNQVETILNRLSESFENLGFEIIEIETEFKTKEDEDSEWMARFGD